MAFAFALLHHCPCLAKTKLSRCNTLFLLILYYLHPRHRHHHLYREFRLVNCTSFEAFWQEHQYQRLHLHLLLHLFRHLFLRSQCLLYHHLERFQQSSRRRMTDRTDHRRWSQWWVATLLSFMAPAARISTIRFWQVLHSLWSYLNCWCCQGF